MPEEIQPTAPDIPVKNKASVLASERKFRDTEVNKILAAFQKVDQNFSALLEEILNISLTPGPEGKTAYEVAVLNGFVGSPTAWLASLVGAPGAPAILTRTSTTEREVGTGSRTFTYTNTPNLGWTVGMRLRATSGANFMEGVIDSVSSTVVTLIVDLIGGSGTHASWNIGVAGQQGSPDTPAQVRDKLSSLEGDERPAVAILRDFVTAVVGQIQTEVPAANQFQYRTVAGVISHVSDYDLKSSFQITFVGDAIHALEFFPNSTRVKKPITEEEFEFSKTGALNKSEVIIHHSAEVVPSCLVPFGPKSIVPAYPDTATMIGTDAQSRQSIGDYYTVDGVTFYRLDVKNGTLGGYTTFAAVAGGEPWGTKPDWVIVQGDPYLTGIDNRNIITATYYDEIKISGTWYYEVVVVNIEAIPNGNFDTEKPNVIDLILMPFSAAALPLAANSLDNTSFFQPEFSPEVMNPHLDLAVFDDLGSGNSAFRRTPSTSANIQLVIRTWVRLNLSERANKILRQMTGITIIARIAFINQHTDPSDTAIIGNHNNEGTKGFSLSRRNTSDQRRIRLRIYTGDVSAPNVALLTIDSNVQEILRNGSYYGIGVTYQWTPGTPNNLRATKMWIKSTANSIPLTQILNTNTTQVLPPIFDNNIRVINLDSTASLIDSATGSRSVSHDFLRVCRGAISDAEVIATLNAIEP